MPWKKYPVAQNYRHFWITLAFENDSEITRIGNKTRNLSAFALCLLSGVHLLDKIGFQAAFLPVYEVYGYILLSNFMFSTIALKQTHK
jgi:hypothetical protein